MDKGEHQKRIYEGVLLFQKAQFKELNKQRNMAKPHWSGDGEGDLLYKLRSKLETLEFLGQYGGSKAKKKKACADIGNYAMFIMDNVHRGNK